MASMYAVYHGPEGLKNIARRIHLLTAVLAEGSETTGLRSRSPSGGRPFFDTLQIDLGGGKQRRNRQGGGGAAA